MIYSQRNNQPSHRIILVFTIILGWSNERGSREQIDRRSKRDDQSKKCERETGREACNIDFKLARRSI